MSNTNAITLAAVRRLCVEMKAFLVAGKVEVVGSKYKRVRIGAVKVQFAVDERTRHSIRVNNRVAVGGIRENIDIAGSQTAFEDTRLFMKPEWHAWKPSMLKITDADIAALTKLVLDGRTQYQWEPDWRHYGGGLIDIQLARFDSGHKFGVDISDYGRNILIAMTGKSVEQLRQAQLDAAEQAAADAAEWYIIRSAPYTAVYGIGLALAVDYTCPKFPNVKVVYHFQNKRLLIEADIKTSDIYHFKTDSGFGEFMYGVDRLVNFTNKDDQNRAYYDMQKNEVIVPKETPDAD